MKWTIRARSLSLWLGVVGLALLLIAPFLPYDMMSYYSCMLVYPCPLYPHMRIDMTWQIWESVLVLAFNLTSVNHLPALLFLYFVPLAIPIMLVINIIRFQHKRALALEIIGCITSSLGLCTYLLFDGFEFLALSNLLPTLGPSPQIAFSLGIGFWLPLLGFLLFLISICIKLICRVDKRR